MPIGWCSRDHPVTSLYSSDHCLTTFLRPALHWQLQPPFEISQALQTQGSRRLGGGGEGRRGRGRRGGKEGREGGEGRRGRGRRGGKEGEERGEGGGGGGEGGGKRGGRRGKREEEEREEGQNGSTNGRVLFHGSGGHLLVSGTL